MTVLSLAARNLLAQDVELRKLVARSPKIDTWIFEDHPNAAKIENTSKCLIVVGQGDPWSTANEHNTALFPTLEVDVWADPTRNENGSVRVQDAKDKIEAIFRLVNVHLHRVSASNRGMPMIWGTEEQIESKTGVVVATSLRASGDILYSPIRDTDGAWMGRMVYNISRP